MTDAPDARPDGGLLRSEAARPYLVVVAMAAAMWIVELIDLLPSTDLDRWGIRPRQLDGLIGIVTTPFLHADLTHLIENTIPFLVLGCVIASSGTQRFVQVTVITAVVAGLGTWLVGPSGTVHIGASGLVFGYLSYLIVRGVFERRLGYLAIGLLVLFFYGGALWGLLPQPGISWQGHIFGALGGVLAAWVIHGRRDEEAA
ncbi:MAG: rhomboid family intramembrane serine protease [Acidimicrobiales bacterium]|nr:rhomboid family intramembrane serine protease [Acidimicrobiales bacterium]